MAKMSAAAATATKPKLLAGGNPQIAKGYGDAPVQAYLAALSGWKHDVARQLDATIEKIVPRAEKAVKWNSPFYGLRRDSWFLSLHMFERFVRVTFFRGSSLRPSPSGTSKYPDVRYYDIHEGGLDVEQFAAWVKQAAKLPGEAM